MARNDPFSIWVETMLAMNAAGLTIRMRLLRLQQAMLSGDASGGPEASRMVTEKIVAAQAGAWRMGAEMAALVLSPPRSATAAATRTRAAVAAGVRPGFKKARTNARRLTRYR
jgi:hypothetical protein